MNFTHIFIAGGIRGEMEIAIVEEAFPFYLSENASPRFLKGSELLKIECEILAGRLFYRFV